MQISSPIPSPDRTHIDRSVQDAEAIVKTFAITNGWHAAIATPLFRNVEIYSTQEQLWRRMLEINHLPATTKLPSDGLAAANEKDLLLAVLPTEYARVRPEYARAPDAWTRLLAHELVHLLHVRIVEGDENAMGPTWFFEALAVIGSGQAIAQDLHFASVNEALAATQAGGRGSYARYGAVLRFFLTRASLNDLVKHAGRTDFETWLRKL